MQIQNEGSIVILYAKSNAAKQWVADHIPEDVQTWGKDGIVVEHSYVNEIVQGMMDEGLEVR